MRVDETNWLAPRLGTGDRSVCIAVLDGVANVALPCFAGAALNQRSAGEPTDHGTFIASILFAQPGSGLRGIALGCRGLLLPIFAMGPGGAVHPASQEDLARAIGQAVESGCDIINISAGEHVVAGAPSPFLDRAVRAAAAAGVLVVAAAGNDGCRCLHVPARLPNVLAVGAMGADGAPLHFSNWGDPDHRGGLIAPGEAIAGYLADGSIARRSGTSYAAAVVSGVAALLLSVSRDQARATTALAVADALLASAMRCSGAACDAWMAGRLNIDGAMNLLLHPTPAADISPAMPSIRGVLSLSEQDRAPVAAELAPQPPSSSPRPAPAASAAAPAAAATSIGTPAAPGAAVMPAGAGGADCACETSDSLRQLVYVIGSIGYDFESLARRDSLAQAMSVTGPPGAGGLLTMHGLPHDPASLLKYLDENPSEAESIVWTVNFDQIPVYAIRAGGAFAAAVYTRLNQFLADQLNHGVQRASIPGYLSGTVQLASGNRLPVIVPALRGMYNWSTEALVTAVVGAPPQSGASAADAEAYAHRRAAVLNFLERVYYELRNLGATSQDRALNYAATNAYLVHGIFQDAIRQGLELDGIAVESSKLASLGHDIWDVVMTFFKPTDRLGQARRLYRFGVDVSDVVPVTVGAPRSWSVY
jgi:cyanobactin maturation PatA/PatG family protease